ncbi:MAG: hypothetical protein EOO81_10360, partial [Oxalobacteraceae bacterium]
MLHEAFDIVVALWPDEITPGVKSFHIGGGCNMRDLSEAHSRVEAWMSASHFEGVLDQVIGSAEHCLYTAIHAALQNLTVLKTSDLDFEAFASRFDGHPNYRVVETEGPQMG